MSNAGTPWLCCRYRLQTVKSLGGVSLMLRLLWACLRWDDMAVKPSAAIGTTRTGRHVARPSHSPLINDQRRGQERTSQI